MRVQAVEGARLSLQGSRDSTALGLGCAGFLLLLIGLGGLLLLFSLGGLEPTTFSALFPIVIGGMLARKLILPNASIVVDGHSHELHYRGWESTKTRIWSRDAISVIEVPLDPPEVYGPQSGTQHCGLVIYDRTSEAVLVLGRYRVDDAQALVLLRTAAYVAKLLEIPIRVSGIPADADSEFESMFRSIDG